MHDRTRYNLSTALEVTLSDLHTNRILINCSLFVYSSGQSCLYKMLLLCFQLLERMEMSISYLLYGLSWLFYTCRTQKNISHQPNHLPEQRHTKWVGDRFGKQMSLLVKNALKWKYSLKQQVTFTSYILSGWQQRKLASFHTFIKTYGYNFNSEN